MDGQHSLSIYALGPVQVFHGEQLLTDWAYLDAVELFFFLLQHTRKPNRKAGTQPLRVEDLHGKTREQIGLELWPNVSPQQLRDKLRSRLYDLRRVLGDGEWILFDNGQYKFNATKDYWFDVEAFEERVAEAGRLQAQSPAQAIACLQKAAALYRGDFLDDLRPTRVQKKQRTDNGAEASGREWHIAQQEALQTDHRHALHTLGQLLFRAQDFEQAAEIYRRAAQDDYDDEAHHGLMLSLGLQGKRSQALEQYRRLLKRRADTPPVPEIVALAERLKRGEELAPRPPVPAPAPRPTPEGAQTPGSAAPVSISAPFQAPTDLPRFVGREPELSAMRAVLAAGGADDGALDTDAARPHFLGGMGGIGKTALAIHLAHSLRADFPDGVLWAHVSTSEPLAILDSWARAFGCDFSALPDLDSRAAALRAVLAGKKVLLILDDVWDAARARPLLVGGPGARVLLTGRDTDLAQALDARIIALPVLAAEESQQLLARIVGPARVMAEAAEADEICRLLGHLPLALDIAAHRLASRPRGSLLEMVARIRVQQQRLAELKIADREVRASFAMSWDLLSERLRATFAALGVFRGRAFAGAALAAVTQQSEAAAREDLEQLVALSLLSFENSIHYRQHPLLADFAREHLQAAEAAEARMARFFLGYATQQRQNYLALEQEWDNLEAGIEVAGQQAMWQELIDYGDVLTNAWFARGRFSYARQAYPLVCAAAKQLEEQDPYIAAMLNWGRACIQQGDYDEAKQRLEDALQTSLEVNDQHGIASAHFNLGHVALELAQHDEAAQRFNESQRLYAALDDQAGQGATLFLLARIQYRQYQYLEVEHLAGQALALFRTTKQLQPTIEILSYLGLAAANQGKHALADQYCQEAMNVCVTGQFQGEMPNVLYTWMQVCYRRGDFVMARQYGERSLALFKATGDRKTQALVHGALLRVHSELKAYDLAETAGLKNIAILRDMRDDWNLVYSLRDLGKLLMRIDRRSEAQQVWQEALEKAQALKHPLGDEVQGLLNQP